MKKGIITFIELVVVGIIIATSFALFFSKKTDKINYAYIKTKLVGYDFLFSSFGYNNNIYESYIQNKIDEIYDKEMRTYWNFSSYYIFFDGILPYNIQVACNCTNETLLELNNLFSQPIYINNREVSITFVYSDIPHIGTWEPISPGDLLLIWGCVDDTVDENVLKGYLLSGKGIINICDATSSVLSRNIYKDIFGIEDSVISSSNNVIITKPNSAYVFSYEPKKYFFEVSLQPTFQNTSYWVYTFNNFITSFVHPKPISDFYNRSIVYVPGINVAGATVNYFCRGGKAIWSADFTRDDSSIQSIPSDEKKFLLSLILAAAEKRGIPDIRYRVKGIPIYYFDVVGSDVFEPYESVFSLYL